MLDPVQGYLVKAAYRFITDTCVMADKSQVDDVWSKHIPSKVSLLVWCLLRNRLPTKDNLVQCGILNPTDDMCVADCNVLESFTHLFCIVIFLVFCGPMCGLGWEFIRSLQGSFDNILFSLPGCQVCLDLLIYS